MDMLPIKPVSIKPTISTANDGGSKSQSGYIKPPEKQDKFEESDESKRLIGEDPVVEERNFFLEIKEFIFSVINNIKNFIKVLINSLSFKFPEKKQEAKEVKTKEFLAYTQHKDE